MHLFNSVVNAGLEFVLETFYSQGVYIKKKISMLTRDTRSSVQIIRGLWGAHFFLFIDTGGFVRLRGLTKIHKSYGGGVQVYRHVGP